MAPLLLVQPSIAALLLLCVKSSQLPLISCSMTSRRTMLSSELFSTLRYSLLVS